MAMKSQKNKLVRQIISGKLDPKAKSIMRKRGSLTIKVKVH